MKRKAKEQELRLGWPQIGQPPSLCNLNGLLTSGMVTVFGNHSAPKLYILGGGSDHIFFFGGLLRNH